MILPIGKIRITPINNFFFKLPRTSRSQLAASASVQGFTLIEVIIAMAIIALTAGIVIPSLGNMERMQLGETGRLLASTIRNTYNEAVLRGQIYRLVFSFKQAKVRVQTTSAELHLDPKSNILVAAKQAGKTAQDNVRGMLGSLGVKGGQSTTSGGTSGAGGEVGAPPESSANDHHDNDNVDALKSLFQVNALGDESGDFQDQGELAFKGSTSLLSILTENMEKEAKEGEVYLYFFPHGYTQLAVINLTNKDGSVVAVKVEPLTARTEVVNNYVGTL